MYFSWKARSTKHNVTAYQHQEWWSFSWWFLQLCSLSCQTTAWGGENKKKQVRPCVSVCVCACRCLVCHILCLACKIAGFDLPKGIPSPVNQVSGHPRNVVAKPRERVPGGVLFLSLCACAIGTPKVTQPGGHNVGLGAFRCWYCLTHLCARLRPASARQLRGTASFWPLWF